MKQEINLSKICRENEMRVSDGYNNSEISEKECKAMTSKGYDLYQLANGNLHVGFEWRKRSDIND